MKVVDPDSLGLDSVVLKNIREYLNDTYVDDGKYVGTMTLVSRKGQVAYLDSLGYMDCLLYTSPSPRDRQKSRMPSSA